MKQSGKATLPTAMGIAVAIVIAGSGVAAAADRPAGANNAPVVLRGTPPAPQPPAEREACPPGFAEDPQQGCVSLGDAGEPEDYASYGYWPYLGFYGGADPARPHRFRGRHFVRRQAFHGAVHPEARGRR